MRLWLLGPPLLLALGVGMQAQTSGGVIVGQTVDAETGRPVAGALVLLNTAPAAFGTQSSRKAIPFDRLMAFDVTSLMAGVHQTIADGQGRFAFTGLPLGTFSLTAGKPGWTGGGYSQQRPDGAPMPVVLSGDGRLESATLRLWKHAAIGGAVVDETGEPIVGVAVRALRRTWLAGRPRYAPATAAPTDDRGVYRLSTLRPGEYVVVITQTPVTLPAAGGPTSFDPAMMQSLIANSGPGTDPNALMSTIAALAGGGQPGAGIRRGEWILQTSAPGSRLVSPAIGANGRMSAYRTTFYPEAATPAQATAIVLGSGQERSGVDFQLRPVPVVQVAGSIAGADAPVTVRLVPPGSDELSSDAGFESASATTAANGTFAFLAVPEGQYTLRVLRTPPPMAPAAAQLANISMTQNGQGNRAMSMGPLTMGMMLDGAQLPSDPVLWAEMPVSVGDTDIAGLALTLRAGYRVSGRAEFEGDAARPSTEQLPRLPIVIERADTSGIAASPIAGLGSNPAGRLDEHGGFQTSSLVPGRYFIRVPFSFSGWTLKSAMLAGRDLADEPLEIRDGDVSGVVLTFADRSAELTGVVQESERRGGLDASVIVFPAQPPGWVDFGSTPRRLRVTRTETTGRFRIGGLPPGEYLAAAVRGDVAGDWQNAVYLQNLSRTATKLTIADGEQRRLDLVVR